MAFTDLPDSIQRLFWELPRQPMPAVRDEDVFAKVCERGSVDEWRWLLTAAGRDRLRQWFAADGQRHLTQRSLRLWACLLECPVPTGGLPDARPQVPWIHN